MSTTNLHVVNGLPTYGKWGGPGWSAGEQALDGAPLTDAQKAIDGVDNLDRLFKTHDLAYDEAAKMTDPAAEAQAILAADMQLMGGMWALGELSDPLAEDYRNQAMKVFDAKIVWDVMQIGSGLFGKLPFIPTWPSIFFTAAQKFRIVFDPLTLDLDGDGLETVGIDPNAPILFDHDADGIKTGTGWVKPDDGMLVMDRNGNGSIDTGRELFGDSTLKSNGQLAADGFDALADLDSNGDGKISSADAQFASLRVWRDLNQDGISQGGELFTLASLGIASISTAKTANSQTLPNENQIADLGQYTRTDGSIGVTGEVSGSLGDINLAADTFHREFTDTLDTSAVSTLPDLQGSGVLRCSLLAIPYQPEVEGLGIVAYDKRLAESSPKTHGAAHGYSGATSLPSVA